jgi:hypothetical protein
LSASDTVSIIQGIAPDDVCLLPLIVCAAALGVGERKARALLVEHGVPVVEPGARSAGVRLSHLRQLLSKRERR